MKAIKDCEWEVEIGEFGRGWCWFADSKTSGISFIDNPIYYSTEKRSQRNWECFAKINKIKKWKYI